MLKRISLPKQSNNMITPTKEWVDIFRNTNGALSVSEAIAIMNIAAQAPPGNYLEMGTHKGKSAQAALCGLQGTEKFFLLEPEFTNMEFLKEAIDGIGKAHTLYRGFAIGRNIWYRLYHGTKAKAFITHPYNLINSFCTHGRTMKSIFYKD